MKNADGSARPHFEAPPRGTRPPNRRQLILAAASQLFAQHEYAHVAMSDIADAVAIRPSALYRHFSGKQDLLREVLVTSFAAFHTALDHAPQHAGEDTLREFAFTVLDQRALGVLWQRAARHLTPQAHKVLRGELRTIAGLLAWQVQLRRPDLDRERAELLAWAVLSALVSVSFHHVELPRQLYDELLIDIASRIVNAQLPRTGPWHQPTNPLRPVPAVTRRDQLVNEATTLFAERGYHGVGIEEIGAAVGIAGPSIYHHFASKSELMFVVMQRGADFLYEHLRLTLADGHNPSATLNALLGTYIDFGLTNNHLLELLVTQITEEPDDWRAIRRIERDYVNRWVRLLQEVHPELSDDEARVRVQAAMNVVTDLGRASLLASSPGLAESIHAISCAIFDLAPATQTFGMPSSQGTTVNRGDPDGSLP